MTSKECIHIFGTLYTNYIKDKKQISEETKKVNYTKRNPHNMNKEAKSEYNKSCKISAGVI
jgi:hypothetical protein